MKRTKYQQNIYIFCVCRQKLSVITEEELTHSFNMHVHRNFSQSSNSGDNIVSWKKK